MDGQPNPNFVDPLEQDSNKKNKDQGSDDQYNSIARLITDLDRRLRTLEERYSNLRKKLQINDQNLIETERSLNKEVRTVNEEITDLKRTTHDFSEKIVLFGNELESSAKKVDVKVIEKYLLLWQPQMFVTRNELKEYLESNKIRLVKNTEPINNQ